MGILAFISINLLIFLGWFIYISMLRNPSLSERIVYAGLLMAAQIVFAELILGAVGRLQLPALITLHLSVTGGLLTWLIWSRQKSIVESFSGVARHFRSDRDGVITPANLALVILGIFLTIWFCTAAYFLPPRGIDDLVAHLPPIYEYVQNQRISLLPLWLRESFAMPQNGEFLFLWPLIFFHEDTFIDLVQYVVALYGMFVVFGLARTFRVGRNDAVFVGLLFLFTPLVLGQAGSNYVDLIVAICYSTLMYAVVRFWQTGALCHLVIAGIATGFGLGVKYNILVAVFAIQPIIVARLWRNGRLRASIVGYAYYLAFSLPLCIYWMARNFLATGFPLYPYRLGINGLHAVWLGAAPSGAAGPGSALARSSTLTDFFRDPVSFSLLYIFQDPGLGSFHGGLGVVFWGLGVPAIAYCIYRAVQSAMTWDFFPALFWGHVPLTFFVFFLQMQTSRLQFNQRLILIVVVFGLIAIGIVLKKMRVEFPSSVSVIRSFCVVAAVLAVVHLARYEWPSFQLKQPVADWISDEQTSEYKYFAQSPWDLPLLRAAWEPLDFLTRPGSGWTVYTAAPWELFWTTPAFGSRIQNRIWNFQREPEHFPDAFIFHRMNDRDLFYLPRKITPEQVWSDGRFELVTQTPETQFWVKSKLLLQPEVKDRLTTYYERTFRSHIGVLESVTDLLSEDSTLVTASPWGHGLKYLSLVGTLQAPVHIVPAEKVLREAKRLAAKKVITIGRPLIGYRSEPVAELESADGTIVFYENRVP